MKRNISGRIEVLESRQMLSVTPELLLDLNPGSTDSEPYFLGKNDDVLFFSAKDDLHGTELWKTDGTPDGTSMILDINGSSYGSVSSHGDAAILDGVIYFAGNNGQFNNGSELWRSDGTAAGTWMVKDVAPGTDSSIPRDLITVGDLVFFKATTNVGKELWVTDGTTAGTKLVKDIYPVESNGPENFFAFLGQLFFTADDGIHGEELWVSDGTTAGTNMVKDINVGDDAYPTGFFIFDDRLFFKARSASYHEYWSTDGTEEGTQFHFARESYFTPFVYKDHFYFMGYDSVRKKELWKSDGTGGGTALLKDLDPIYGGSPRDFFIFDDLLYFIAADGTRRDYEHGFEIWKTDGTAEGTQMVKDINPGKAGSDVTFVTPFLDTFYFVAKSPTTGFWMSDGSAGGTTEFSGPVQPSSIFWKSGFVELNDRLLFVGQTPSTGHEIFSIGPSFNGTSGDDVFNVRMRPDRIDVDVNGVRYTVENEDNLDVLFDGGFGNDLIRVTGTNRHESAVLRPGRFEFSSGSLNLMGDRFDTININGAGGNNVLRVIGSNFDDTVIIRPGSSILRSQSRIGRGFGFQDVFADGKGGNDFVRFIDSKSNDDFFGQQESFRMTGQEFDHRATGFERTVVLSNQGGRDRAFLTDSDSKNDTFYGRQSLGRLTNNQSSIVTRGFDVIEATASGGFDVWNVLAINYLARREGKWDKIV